MNLTFKYKRRSLYCFQDQMEYLHDLIRLNETTLKRFLKCERIGEVHSRHCVKELPLLHSIKEQFSCNQKYIKRPIFYSETRRRKLDLEWKNHDFLGAEDCPGCWIKILENFSEFIEKPEIKVPPFLKKKELPRFLQNTKKR